MSVGKEGGDRATGSGVLRSRVGEFNTISVRLIEGIRNSFSRSPATVYIGEGSSHRHRPGGVRIAPDATNSNC